MVTTDVATKHGAAALLLPLDAHKQRGTTAAAALVHSTDARLEMDAMTTPPPPPAAAVATTSENQQPEAEDDMASPNSSSTSSSSSTGLLSPEPPVTALPLPAMSGAMAVTPMPSPATSTPATRTPQLESSDESDWRTSSCSESPARFSLIDLPAKMRASLFTRKPRKLKRKAKTTRSADAVRGDGGDTSSSGKPTLTSMPSLRPELARAAADAAASVSEPDRSGESFKHFWDEKLRSTMEKLTSHVAKTEASTSDGSPDVFHLLLKLYAHQDIVEELYSSCEANAVEFEFYIPQLCTFLLHGNYAKQHQLECFLMSRSGESLPFAHRLTWFLRSFCDDAKRYKSEYLSVTASQDHENSDLLTAIEQRAGVPALLMNNGLCTEEVSVSKPSNLLRRRSSIFAIDEEMDPKVLETDESFAGHLQSKRQLVVYEARPEEGNSQQTSLYKQTPDFVSALTDLADHLIGVALPERTPALRTGLSMIQDQVLPSDVLYLPIGNTHHRVKAIHVDECFTFSTKERVPYFLVVEVLDYSASASTAINGAISSSPKHHPPHKLKKKKSLPSPASPALTAQDVEPAPRAPSRGFTLMLPFLKTGHAVEPSATPTAAPTGDTPNASAVSEPTMSHESERSTDSSTALSASSDPLVTSEDGDVKAATLASAPPANASLSTDKPSDGAAPSSAATSSTASSASSSFAPVAFIGYLLGTTKKPSAPHTAEDVKEMEVAGAVPLTPREPLDGGEEGDDEKEHDDSALALAAEAAAAAEAQRIAEQDAAERAANELQAQANEEQKQRMGQWSLPRAGRRKARSSASARSGGQFDTFYSSWFAKKQKHEQDAVCTNPESALTTSGDSSVSSEVVNETSPVEAPAAPTAPEAAASAAPAPPTDAVEVPDATGAALEEELNSVEPIAPENAQPTANNDDGDTSQDEGGGRRKRDRDLSMSLDFTDSNAWKVKFDLEDALTDTERAATDACDKDALADATTSDGLNASSNNQEDDDDEEEEDETPIIVFRERWSEKEARIRATSPFRDHPGWRLLSVIVKSNDDLRQEQFAAQLIAQCDRIFHEYALPLRLRYVLCQCVLLSNE